MCVLCYLLLQSFDVKEENGLVYEYTFDLNKSKTKKLVFGLNPYTHFGKEIRMYDNFGDYIVLNIEEVKFIADLDIDKKWDFKKAYDSLLIYRIIENNIFTLLKLENDNRIIVDPKEIFKMKIGMPTILKLKENYNLIQALSKKVEKAINPLKNLLHFSRIVGAQWEYLVPSIEDIKLKYFNDDEEYDDFHFYCAVLLKYPKYLIKLLNYNIENNISDAEKTNRW